MESEGRPGGHRVWAISDGRAGNAAQAEGLGQALAARLATPLIAVHTAPSALGRALPAWAWHGLGRLWPGAARASVAGQPFADAPAAGDIAVGAGRRAAPLVARLGRQGVRTVQLLDPQMPLSAFDAVVVPEHDGREAPNLLPSLGALGGVDPARIAAEAEAWAPRLSHLPARRLAVLVGGPGRMAGWGAEDAPRLLAALEALAAEGWTLLLTTSRRTDPELARALAERFGAAHLVHSGTGANPYPAILGLAEAVLVTADSVNMVSEAAATGRPIHIFALAAPSEKARRFHASLAERGIVRPFAGEIERWDYAPLAETQRIAELLAERFAPKAA